MVNPQPEGYGTLNISLTIDGAADAIEFYKQVLGATERMRMSEPDGRIGHAELQIGDSVLMVNDEYPDMDIHSPKAYGGAASAVSVYVADADAAFEKAIDLGATALRPVEDQFYGDRSGQFLDPWGHRWGVATHVEDVSPDEMERRAAAAMGD